MTKQEKFMNFLKPVQKNLERFALSISDNYDDAKDLIAETVFEAYKNFDSLKNEQAFLSYLFTIARRLRYANYRKRKKVNTVDIDSQDNLISNIVSPDIELDIKFFHEALKILSDKEREAFVLSEINDLLLKEVAIIQNSTLAAVKVRIYRAKKKLEKYLANDVKIYSITNVSNNNNNIEFSKNIQ
jgi:RNA polymerase sigma factor (sigma-70 family)